MTQPFLGNIPVPVQLLEAQDYTVFEGAARSDSIKDRDLGIRSRNI